MELFGGRCKLSPLILAILFISFFHNVLSRHRIRHHKDRFKRQQGAHLYLPASFVTDVDDAENEIDAGPWGDWSAPSPCSRSCGGGVATQQRTCQQGFDCRGASRKHFSCNTQDCPDLADYRAQQCASFDSIPFEGVSYQWVPYTKAPNECELNCMPRGERFYYRHASAVIDGTRCNDEKFDVCVSGKCRTVGCDHMLGSRATEDQCRVCGGDGTSCNTFSNTIEMKDMIVGYNDILLIPAGATNIRVEELAPSNNYLAVRNKSGHYYLNGNWRIDFPRTLDFAGCRFKYERSPQEFAAPDVVTCLGPTEESLFMVLLYQDSEVPIRYTYSLPTDIPPPSEETYVWTYDEFTPCSATCGGGEQFRNVTCVGRASLDPADRLLCDAGAEPDAHRRCAEVACAARWAPQPWGACSAACGDGGVQRRAVACQRVAANGLPEPADERECADAAPPTQRRCNVGKVCAEWHEGPWRPCDHLCGDGLQTRKVQCFIRKNNKIEVLEDSECEAIEPKPVVSKKCRIRPCEGVDWITSEWSGCDRICGLKNETRQVRCATASGEIQPDDLCESDQKPATIRICESNNATCQYLWYASQWSECSVTCGEGVQTRNIFCGVPTVDGVQIVEEDKCDPSKHFETMKNCTGEEENCEGEWFSGPWGECSKPCGGGERQKKVVCIKDLQVVGPELCGSETITFGQETCNNHPCSEDTIMPTDVTHPVDESEPTISEGNTTEASSTITVEIIGPTPTEEDVEYEIVPDTNCDDGEWVEVDEVESPIGQEHAKSKRETYFSLDDMMMGDGIPIFTDDDLGSGDTSTTDFEGSGTESTYSSSLSSESSVASESTTELTSEITPSDITTGTDETTIAGVTTVSYSSTVSESTTSVSSETEIADTTGLTSESNTEASGVSDTTVANTQPVSGSTESAATSESLAPGSMVTEFTTDMTISDLSSESTASASFRSEGNTEASGVYETTVASTEASTESFSDGTGSDVSPGSTDDESVITDASTQNDITQESTTLFFIGEPDQSILTNKHSSGTTVVSGSTESDSTTFSSEITGSTSIVRSSSTESSDGKITTGDNTSEVSSTSEGPTESTTQFTGSTEATTEFTGSTEATTEFTGSTESTTVNIETSSSTLDLRSESEDFTESTTQFIGSTEATTEFTGSTEATTEFTGSTEATTEFTGSTEATTEFTGSTESTTANTQISTSSSDMSSMSRGSSESTVEFTGSTESTTGSIDKSSSTLYSSSEAEDSSESTTQFTGGTEATTEFTGSTEATTEFTGSTEATTEFTGSTEATTEFTGSTESSTASIEISTSTSDLTPSEGFTESTVEFTGSTESTIEYTGSTVSYIYSSTTEEVTTTDLYSKSTIFDFLRSEKVRMCKRRKLRTCRETKYGCCWDNITPAKGPFDKGCPTPHTCQETKYGCCKDEVSAALGPKFAGCPSLHCNETLYGCCPDDSTPAEGNDNEGCPPICLISEYGCCDDNVTEATGPNHEGCEETELSTTEEMVSTTELTTEFTETTEESSSTGLTESTITETSTEPVIEDCKNTIYRCCPDGLTVAAGPGFRGCNLPCSNSTFGCCQDARTPAHGPSGEGCCLTTPFGCCPDDIVAARGPNMEGCDCNNSPYGCCPDNETAARGYDNEGCGCQSSEFGCCPDALTPANGVDFQGCLCHTFQFGCCPDGITIARGPHQQGCGCRNTEFGCCSDEQTPASGPQMEGCGCENSKYGCCIDGITEAKGENYEGCETAPQNLQIGCSIPKERGTCRNYTVKWFFDMDYGGCSRFWYGGCEGNENRYKSKEECESICVKPEGTDRCNLPKVAGPCEGYYPVWYYDKDLKNCAQFVYGGCLGNNNKFETREQCLSQCVTDDSPDPCQQKQEPGPCNGQYQRYWYDGETGQCQAFIYGGCKGNKNNFPTIEACRQQCATPGEKKDQCSLPKAQGNCTDRVATWYFDTPDNRCKPFYFSGCNGNQNNFENREACESICPKEVAKDACQLPAESGDCANYVDRWYFDTREKSCRQFYYGGCGGNENNFESQQRCQDRCVNAQTPVAPTISPTQQVEPFKIEMCFLPRETGPCRASFPKYFYDSTDGVCKSFIYGGCDGNRNNFETAEECIRSCGVSQDLCTLPPVVGPCNNSYPQYYYEPSSDTCQRFNYGGCGGNYNRFQDIISCEQRCRVSSSSAVTQSPQIPSDMKMCFIPVDSGNCTDNYVAYYFDKDSSKCAPFTYTGCGGNDNRFNSEEQCERQCGSFRGQDVCNMDRDVGPCRGYFVKYFYNKYNRRCEQFAFGGCQGNGNRFSSAKECEDICVVHEETKPNITATAICQLQVDKGSCEEGYHKRWYFDDLRGECIAFIFSGCGGNFNNFKSYQSCLDFCHDLLPQTEPPLPDVQTDMPPHPCQEVFDECTTLRCAYGVEPYVDDNECNRCRCRDPCMGIECPEDEQCAIDINRNKTSARDADFIAICRKRVKPGECPNLEINDNNCEEECRTDADCTLHLKCCSTGCGTACVDPTPPAQLITQQPQPAHTEGPIEAQYRPPKVDTLEFKPETTGLIGDQATLRCAISGNPNPRIRWSKDDLMIDGTQPRYRIKLDQSLQIITLHKTDSGIYLCTADNGIGEPITNQIRLDVLDSDPRPVTMLDDPAKQPPQIVSLNAPATLNCFVLGHPFPSVTWWKDDSMLPFKNAEFEVRKDYSLLIHSVKLRNLGIYTCQAYNGFGRAASWSVTVKARGPYHFRDAEEYRYREFIVDPPQEPTPTTPPPVPKWPPSRPTPQPFEPPLVYTEPSNEILPGSVVPTKKWSPPSLVVPLKANITTVDTRYPIGGNIELPCEVTGHPTPQVQWYKDGIQLNPSERIDISDINTLSIKRATKADSGFYQCEATNAYSKASSALMISIEGMYIHPSCTDNQFFANCALIVKAQYCTHKYYARFCCRSCTEAGLLPVDGPHLQGYNKANAIANNFV